MTSRWEPDGKTSAIIPKSVREKIAFLGIIGYQLRAPRKPLRLSQALLYCTIIALL